MMGSWLLLFMLLLVAIGYVAYRLGQNGSSGPLKGELVHGDEALETVRSRYAEGKIDREEFERLRRDLA